MRLGCCSAVRAFSQNQSQGDVMALEVEVDVLVNIYVCYSLYPSVESTSY
jgi:hypothetical protein